MALLQGLDRIDWNTLHHAYGPATDVPDLLRALVEPAPGAGDRDVFEQVTWELWGNVFHQGSVWQVSATVVPFLEEILRDGPDEARLQEFLVSYLHHLAMGYPEDMFPEPLDIERLERQTQDEVAPASAPDYAAGDVPAHLWMRDWGLPSDAQALRAWLDA